MVAMAVSDVHMSESFIRISILDPVGKSGALSSCEKGIDKHGFVS